MAFCDRERSQRCNDSIVSKSHCNRVQDNATSVVMPVLDIGKSCDSGGSGDNGDGCSKDYRRCGGSVLVRGSGVASSGSGGKATTDGDQCDSSDVVCVPTTSKLPLKETGQSNTVHSRSEKKSLTNLDIRGRRRCSSSNINHTDNYEDVFDTSSSSSSKQTPFSKLLVAQTSPLSPNSTPSLLCRRLRRKQSCSSLINPASLSLRQENIPEEEERGDTSIVQKMFERAAADLHSWDQRKVQNAKFMLRRLRQVGVVMRPKAMSYPDVQSHTPIIKINVCTPDSTCDGGSGVANRKLSQPQRRLSSFSYSQPKGQQGSEPNLYSGDNSFLFEAADPISKRKDSVSRIRKKSTVQSYTRRLSSTSLGSQHVSLPLSQSFRRSSLCGSVTSRGNVSPFQDNTFHWKEDGNLVTWSNLLACIPSEERKSVHIRRHHVFIPVPVCVVGKENSVMFTSLEVIEQTLRRLHPEVIVKRRLPQDADEAGGEEDGCPDEMLLTKDQKTKRPSKVSMASRKMSINTCITSMRSGPGDYDKQLTGIKSVGSFAEEEELKFLIAKRDAIACVIEAMKYFPEKEELQLNACESLLKMASASESNCVHILNNDGLEPICKTLRLHIDKVEIVRRLLSTIAFISTAHDLAKSLVATGIHSEILQAMSMHSTDAEIVKESCYIIGNLLISVETAQQLMYVAGVHTVIGLVNNFSTDASILENACRTLGNFAAYDETCLDVASAGATSAVLDAVTSSAANASVIECGCWALATLTATGPTCGELVQLGGVRVILQILTDYTREESLQGYGIRVLCNLSMHEETLSAVCTETVFKLLHNAMVFFSESVELLEIIAVSLCQIISGFDTLQRMLSDTCFVRDLVNVMLEFPENLLIQEHGCQVIGNVSVEDDLRKMAEAQGASKAVISAMLTNNTDLNIQEVGCMAIMNLTAENKENKVRIKNAGVVQALLNTLDEFRHDPNIVLCALKALGNLISLEEVCHLLLDEKGLHILISMMDLYEDEEDILTFLAMIFCGITELLDLKEEETDQIDQVLIRIRSSCQNNADIALFICQATENLIRTAHGHGLETFLQKKRLGATLTAMHCFPDNAEIHRTCCKLIAVVAYHMDCKKRLITETTVKNVLKSMELFPFDVDLQIIVCGTISCIVQKITILRHELIGHGGIGLLKKAIDNHPKESRVAVMVLMVLGHILPIDHSTYPMEGQMAFDLILLCMKNFTENEEIQLAGCSALSKCHIPRTIDNDELTETVIQALRRHGEDPEMQRKAAEALKNANSQAIDLLVSDEPTSMPTFLNSPKVVVTTEFWKIWES